MKKTLGLTRKILDGRKKIESRWYSVRCRPWNNIKKGETVYFKDSGEPVRIKTEVSRVVQFSELTPDKVGGILEKYGENIGIGQERIPLKLNHLILIKSVLAQCPLGLPLTMSLKLN